METAFLVFVGFQSVFSFICVLSFIKASNKLASVKRKQKQVYEILCSFGNDTGANFHKVFSFIEHELARQHVSDQNNMPGSSL